MQVKRVSACEVCVGSHEISHLLALLPGLTERSSTRKWAGKEAETRTVMSKQAWSSLVPVVLCTECLCCCNCIVSAILEVPPRTSLWSPMHCSVQASIPSPVAQILSGVHCVLSAVLGTGAIQVTPGPSPCPAHIPQGKAAGKQVKTNSMSASPKTKRNNVMRSGGLLSYLGKWSQEFSLVR